MLNMKDKYQLEGYHDKIKYDFVGTEGLHFIDFRTAQPAGPNGIVQFLTSDIYIVFHDLKNGKGMFNVATCLLGIEKSARFKQEFAVRFNHERVKEAFRDPHTFVFFSESEAEILTTLFKEEYFTSAKVGVFSRKTGGNIFRFDSDEYDLVTEFLRKHGIRHAVPGINQTEFTDAYLREEIMKEAEKKVKKELRWFNDKGGHLSREKIRRISMATAGLFAVSSVLLGIGKSLVGKGWAWTLVGGALYALGAIGNMLAFKTGNTLITKFNEEVIFG